MSSPRNRLVLTMARQIREHGVEGTGLRPVVAEACAALGDAVHDDARGAELWEESAFILIDELSDLARGEFALSRAVERDIRRFKSFDKLFRLVRERKALLDLLHPDVRITEHPNAVTPRGAVRDRDAVVAGGLLAEGDGGGQGKNAEVPELFHDTDMLTQAPPLPGGGGPARRGRRRAHFAAGSFCMMPKMLPSGSLA